MRQHWQMGTFTASADVLAGARSWSERQRAYVEFMLRLYHATPLAGGVLLHGVKNGRLVHVGGVDAPVSDGDIRQLAAEFKRAVGTGKDAPTSNGVDVLGWDFAFEVNEVARQQAERANVNLRFLRIPRDVKFFELGEYNVMVKVIDILGNDTTKTVKIVVK